MLINRLYFQFCQGIRLSKYLSQTSICSRRQAEQMIKQGMIKVDGKQIDSNIAVTKSNKIQVFTKNGERMPIQQSTKVWIFYKPVGLICTHDDPFKRPTIFQYAKEKLKTKDHLMSVGRLDYNSEGLIVLTNDGALARCMELPQSKIVREYRVRVYGTFTEQKLLRIREGVTINGIKYGPYWVNVENRQNRNTWLLMRLDSGKNREIRRVMRKFSLRVNRLIRLSYGPYKLRGLKAGEFYEASVEPQIKRKMYLYTRKSVEQFQKQQDQIEGVQSKQIDDQHIQYKQIQ